MTFLVDHNLLPEVYLLMPGLGCAVMPRDGDVQCQAKSGGCYMESPRVTSGFLRAVIIACT